METKKKVVQDVIFNTLKVNAPVVLLENDFIEAGLEKDDDFTKLPNGELQPKNSYDACQEVLRKINVSSFLTANKKETDKTSNCVGEMGRWGEVLR